MNNGEICISVCAETADKMIEQIKRAEQLADIIEIRFDCLNDSEIKLIWNSQVASKPEICTFRPQEQGGKRHISKKERLDFWRSGNSLDWVDFEIDLYEMNVTWNHRLVICSNHDFDGVPENLVEIYNKLKTKNASVIKIAVQTNDITETIPIWKLLEKAKSENQQIIPIAMGESGKWTRILGLAHGAFMTYASLESGKETASGQVSANDLIEVYRAKELNELTEIYGVIGGDTTYSMSPYIHNAAFKFYKLNSVFVPLQVQDLDEFLRRMVKQETHEIELNFKGFSVTIPHKQNIIKHLDHLDETAKAIGAVNTVKIVDGKLHGYNTDAEGFIEPLKNAYGDLKDTKVAILGNGGAARACIYALKKENADITIFARNLAKAETLANEFEVELKELDNADFNDFDIVVNTTPLGTKGVLETETPAVAEQIAQVKLVYDLVYNPFETRFLKEAKSVFVPTIGGMAMLIAQAMRQFEIWTEKDAPMKEMSQAVLKRLT